MIKHEISCRNCGGFDEPLIELEKGEVVINKAEREFILKEIENAWTDHESYEVGKELFRKLRGEM